MMVVLVFVPVILSGCHGGGPLVTTDVYVAGFEYSRKAVATYWKNRTAVPLTDGTQDAIASSITVSGSDVYVAGYESDGSKDIAMYWKNGEPIPLTDGTQDAIATSITISEGDVYVAGFEFSGTHYVAKYWKNGIPVQLTDESSAKSEFANSITVLGGDVYVTGYNDTTHVLKYWENGNPVQLSSKPGYAYSIFKARVIPGYNHGQVTGNQVIYKGKRS